ncbi:MAG: hypothetical protein ACPG6V_11545 [Flavobacteriales bacterium]
MKNILAIVLVGLFVFSCKKDKSEPTFKHSPIPSDITKTFEQKGDEDSDTVWIYVQGGPTEQREYALVDTYSDGSDVYPFFTDDLMIFPYQAQHLDKTIATSELFNFEDAKEESEKTAEIVVNIANHFTSKNKVVYIIGHSFGSLVVHEILAKFGNPARKMLSLNGRMDMDEVVWKGFSKGEEWLFDNSGLNPMLNTGAVSTLEEKNMRKLAAGLGHNRYTELFANRAGLDLSNVLFLTAEDDKYVGDYTQKSLDYLGAKAELMFVLPQAGHSDVFIPSILKSLHDLMIKND